MANQDSERRIELDSFLSLIPFVVLLLIGNTIACFGTEEFQSRFFISAWIFTALIVLRIQSLIAQHSYDSYPYKPLPCAVMLAAVVLSPWIWLHFASYPLGLLVHYGIVQKSATTWICGFTLSATATSLAFVSPMIEGWYELLRGSFAFDGSRIKRSKHSVFSQLILFLVFCGLLIAPIDVFGPKAVYGVFHTESLNIIGGFFATFIALLWLLVELEEIRIKQLSSTCEVWCPVDKNLLVHASRPLGDTIGRTKDRGRRVYGQTSEPYRPVQGPPARRVSW